MRLLDGFHFATGSESLQPIFAHRLQHQEAWYLPFLLRLPQQTLIEERGHALQDCFRSIIQSRAEGLDGFQGAATNEDGQPPEEALFLGSEQVVAPGDGMA